MPERRLKLQPSLPDNRSGNGRDQRISTFLMTTVEQIRSVMSASGAVIAVRDPEGACCLASAGEAPAVGSRLQPDSVFTRACFESGEVVLCEDTEKDSRIQPAVAKSLCLRSAVAVPIHAQGSVVGVIEVFSSRPSDIYPEDLDALKEFAKLFAPIIAPGPIAPKPVPSAQPSSDGPALACQAEPLSPADEQDDGPVSVSANWFPKEPRLPRERQADTPRPLFERGSALAAALPSNSQRSVESSTAGPTSCGRAVSPDSVVLPRNWQQFVENSTAAQIFRGRAASLSLLAVLFLFLFFFLFGTSRPMTISTSYRSPAPPPAGPAKRDASASRPGKALLGRQLDRKAAAAGSFPRPRSRHLYRAPKMRSPAQGRRVSCAQFRRGRARTWHPAFLPSRCGIRLGFRKTRSCRGR